MVFHIHFQPSPDVPPSPLPAASDPTASQQTPPLSASTHGTSLPHPSRLSTDTAATGFFVSLLDAGY